MELIDPKPLSAGNCTLMFVAPHGHSPIVLCLGVELVDDLAIVHSCIGTTGEPPEAPNFHHEVASVVAYMRLQGYQLLSHTLYVGERRCGAATAQNVHLNAVFRKMP